MLACLGADVVGVASYEMNDGESAEVAFAVADRMHRHGIATLLLEHLVSIARQHQIRAFTAETLAENSAMLQGLRRRRAAGAASTRTTASSS